jgi:hypothetical protein
VGLVDIVRRTRTAHARGYPPRLQRIGKHVAPMSRNCECQKDIVQLALGIRSAASPVALVSGYVGEVRLSHAMHSRA